MAAGAAGYYAGGQEVRFGQPKPMRQAMPIMPRPPLQKLRAPIQAPLKPKGDIAAILKQLSVMQNDSNGLEEHEINALQNQLKLMQKMFKPAGPNSAALTKNYSGPGY